MAALCSGSACRRMTPGPAKDVSGDAGGGGVRTRGVQRLALFALDNTLVDLDAAFAVRAAEFAGAYGLGQQAVDWLVALNRQGYPHREVFFAKVREHFALAEPVEELWRWYRRRMPYLVHCRPEVMEGLARLRADGWKVGIVTNGTADNQLGKLQQTGLAQAVDGCALSGVEGVRKPDTGLFEIAAKRCGVTLAGGGWMVGDHPVADIGAVHRRLPVLVSREGPPEGQAVVTCGRAGPRACRSLQSRRGPGTGPGSFGRASPVRIGRRRR